MSACAFDTKSWTQNQTKYRVYKGSEHKNEQNDVKYSIEFQESMQIDKWIRYQLKPDTSDHKATFAMSNNVWNVWFINFL